MFGIRTWQPKQTVHNTSSMLLAKVCSDINTLQHTSAADSLDILAAWSAISLSSTCTAFTCDVSRWWRHVVKLSDP